MHSILLIHKKTLFSLLDELFRGPVKQILILQVGQYMMRNYLANTHINEKQLMPSSWNPWWQNKTAENKSWSQVIWEAGAEHLNDAVESDTESWLHWTRHRGRNFHFNVPVCFWTIYTLSVKYQISFCFDSIVSFIKFSKIKLMLNRGILR